MQAERGTVDLDTMPQWCCPACGITSKTAALWPKTTPAQVPLALAKTPLKRPEKGGKNFGPPLRQKKRKSFRVSAD